MFENLQVFRMAQAMAVHAGTRQSLVARNMANADTPGYSARDIPAFAKLMQTASSRFDLRATRGSHLNTTDQPFAALAYDRAAERDPNGNSVSLETEMMHAVNTRRQHDRALAIYKSSLSVLRSAIGTR